MHDSTATPGTDGSAPALPVWEPLLTSDEAAERLRVHTKTAIRMARAHILPAVRIGKLWRFRESDLTHWLDEEVQSARQPSERPEN